MNADFYALDHAMPTLAVSNVRFFDLWTVLTAELADYYGEEADSLKLVEASWNNEEEYADVVTLNGRIVGALHRPLTQENVAAIWGVNRMEKRAFVNRIRSLYNIDGDLLRELTREEQSKFLANPVRFFLDANEAQSDAIMREIEARQNIVARRAEPVAQHAGEAMRESNNPTVAKSKRKKKPLARVDGQRELLLPITGGAGKITPQANAAAAAQPREILQQIADKKATAARK